MLRAVKPLPNNPLLTTEQVAVRIGMSPGVVRSLMASGAIPCIKSGDDRPHYYAHQAELEDWIARGRPRTPAPVVGLQELIAALGSALDDYQVTIQFRHR